MAPNDSDESKLVQGKYSIRWLETVFTSKAVTEELLSPERENGNLTTNDYERAIDFLPRAKQLKLAQTAETFVSIVMATILIRYKGRSLPTLQKLYGIGLAGFAGWTFGNVSRLYQHAQYVKSIENTEGYVQAIRNVESRVGISNDKFGGIHVGLQAKVNDSDNHEIELKTIMLPSSTDTDTSKPTALQSQAMNKWDEIRKANGNAAKNSSWDALRQKHEREGVKSRSRKSDSEPMTEQMSDPAVETDATISIDRLAESGDKY